MKILITGTNEFIGQALFKKLEKQHTCFSINQDIFKNENWIAKLNLILNDELPNAIFHVSECSDTLNTDVNFMMTRNYEFTKQVSEYAAMKNIPLIYSSSAANYGVNNQYPSNLYGWSKYLGEQYVIQNGGIALRYFNVYGPGEAILGKMASIAYQMMTKKKNGEVVKLFPLEPKRDFVYIDDVVDANLHAFNDFDEYAFYYYEVGSGESKTYEDVLKILKIDYTYLKEKDIPKDYQFFTQSDKNKWMSGWTPKYNLEQGLNDYITKINFIY